MGELFKKFISAMQVPPLDPLARPLLTFVANRPLNVGEAHKGTLMLGSPGEGKTTAARTLLVAMMRQGFGGLVTIVKSDFVADVVAAAEVAHRSPDVVVLRRDGPHRFNPFADLTDASAATALLVDISDAVAGGDLKKGDDGSWREQRKTLLENLCTVCLQLHGQVSFAALRELYDAVPQSAAGTEDARFKATALGRLHHGHDNTMSPVVRDAVRFLAHDFPAYPDRTQGSVRAMLMPVFHNFTRPALASIFGGDSTVTTDDVLNNRRILLVDLAATGEEGRCANAVLQYCFCKSALTLTRQTDAFLMCDEFQETVSPKLIEALSLFRQFRVSTVLISQSIPTIRLRTGDDGCKVILGLMHTMILFAQKDPDTREWAEIYLGEEEFTRKSDTRSDGKTSMTYSKDRRPKLRREAFLSLKIGYSYCFTKDAHWRAKWPKQPPRGDRPIRIGD